jgi:hypothetical protein
VTSLRDFFGALGAAWNDAMVTRWSANPLGMLWPDTDSAFVTARLRGGTNHAAEGSGHHHRC